MEERVMCKFYPKALCLTGDEGKCDIPYNEHNTICPYLGVHESEKASSLEYLLSHKPADRP